ELSPRVKSIHATNKQGLVTGEVALTPIQHWFFEQKFHEPHHWNQSMMLFHPQGWNPKWIQQVFEKLIAHHDALRMTYHVENGRIQQVNRGLEGDFFVFHSFDLRGVNHVRTE